MSNDVKRQKLLNAVAVRMRTRRQRRGLSQAEAARLLGVEPSQLNRWEAAIHPIPIHMLAGYAALMGCEVTEFLRANDGKGMLL